MTAEGRSRPRPNPARRTVLAAGVAGGLATLAGCGFSARKGDAALEGLVRGSFRSARMGGRAVGYAIAHPSGKDTQAALPVAISLHGRGANHTTAFAVLHLDRVLDDVVAQGVAPFALVSVDGGDHGYWHARADGTDAGAMVAEELVPMLATRGLDTTRIGLHGWSMGGYGALLLAGRRRIEARAVAVASPALFAGAGNTPPGAFDDAADYLRNDVYGRPELLDDVPLRVDCGRSDPFYAASRRFVGGVHPAPVTSFGAGGHDSAYWRSVAGPELTFLGRHLAR
jgi:enterochelin esterase-like enzyme